MSEQQICDTRHLVGLLVLLTNHKPREGIHLLSLRRLLSW